MTDDITHAVRRLKGLKEDVERLKAATDEAGELRLLRRVGETASSADIATEKDHDAADETASSEETTEGYEHQWPAFLMWAGVDADAFGETEAFGEGTFGGAGRSARWNVEGWLYETDEFGESTFGEGVLQ